MYRVDKMITANAYGAGSNGMDWFEGHIPNPALVCQDMAYALRPEQFAQYSNTTYLRNVMLVRAPGLTSHSPRAIFLPPPLLRMRLLMAIVASTALAWTKEVRCFLGPWM